MTWPFENDTSAITKKIAKNDIDKNRVKKVFSLTTIVFATALLMMLVMFESGYETTKDRMAEGQPQVVFYDLSQQQIELLYWEENIESIKVTETENGYDASIATVYKGNIIKNLIMDCQSYTKYRPNETTGGIFVSWRRKEELPTGA